MYPSMTRILIISLFHPELLRGGAQQLAYELFQGLRAREDCETTLLAAIDPQFTGLYKPGAHITGFDGRPGEFLLLTRDYNHLWHKNSAPQLMESLAEFLRLIDPQIVHVHHFFKFGIDSLSLIRHVLPNCRLIFTFHEFLAICAANGHMLRKTDGSLCTQASQVRCHQCFPEQSPEHFLMRKLWFERHFQAVDAFTCPSHFMVERYASWGILPEKITVIANGQANYAAQGELPAASASHCRFGFFGQYVDAKGIHIILRAVALLRGQGFTDFSVDLNGDNIRYASAALRSEIEAFLAAEAALPPRERIVTDRGSYEVSQLGVRMAGIDWCLMPSIWPESFGLVMSEAWMFGRPVICSDAGAMAERTRHNETGLLFRLGEPASLADTMRRACTEAGLWDRLRAGLPKPPALREMVDKYLAVYRQ
jgi:glycosyltransferase involved in cell wall biosynthesis